ncbi:MAG: NAD(P)/FAD-dependent oxidoreductase [Alphaproteobacteria bacterium]|jgi:cyclohexanone monooxygenase|nr:NAD(P)/FAD-dependent oxidoreductase [Alphaproteobacteria bacterium]
MSDDTLDAVIVGAGFAGLYMLHRLRAMGFSARVLEAGSGVGGTWYWNRYPGARCDVESMEYSYQFSEELQQEWEWSERYSPQPEILRYANHVADRFDLRRDITFDTRVESATFDEAAGHWIVRTDGGEQISATHCVMATGCLSSPNKPWFEGLDSYKGATYHTGEWPHEGVDFAGMRVGVIGTGSSAIQSISIIAEQAAHLTVFQRTPNFSVPAHNAPLDPQDQQEIKADYPRLRALGKHNVAGLWRRMSDDLALEASPEERQREFETRWAVGGLQFRGAFADLIVEREANRMVAEFIRDKIRAMVQDPAVADLLCPTSLFGCKRVCVDTGYYETYNRPNITLVDVSQTPIEAITPDGLTVGGEAYGFDAIVFATGFDAMTGALQRIDIRGTGGRSLNEKWVEGPRTYLGLAMAGFPNLFTITGPGSPSVLTNMLPSIEQHVEWIADCMAYLRDGGMVRIEATGEAEDAWVAHVHDVAHTTLYPFADSWYLGANVPGKPRVFMPYIGFPPYVRKCDEVAANGYQGFTLTPALEAVAG